MDTVFTAIERSLEVMQFIYDSIQAGNENPQDMAALRARTLSIQRRFDLFCEGTPTSQVQQDVATRIHDDFVLITAHLQQISKKIDSKAPIRKLLSNVTVHELLHSIQDRLEVLEKHLDLYGLVVDQGCTQRALMERHELLLREIMSLLQGRAGMIPGLTAEHVAVLKIAESREPDAHQDEEEEKQAKVIAVISKTQHLIQTSRLSEREKNQILEKVESYEKLWRLKFDDLTFETNPRTNQWVQIGKGGSSRVFRAKLRRQKRAETDQYGWDEGDWLSSLVRTLMTGLRLGNWTESAGEELVDVAVKVLDVDESQLEQFQPHFLREILALVDFTHPCILRTYGGIWPDNADQHSTPMIVTELMSADLTKAIMDPALQDVNVRKSIAVDVAAALNLLHSNGVLHCDVKPENVLVRFIEGKMEGRAKLGDFGVSRKVRTTRQMSTYSTTGAAPGTISYMPPEVLMNMRECPTRRSWDVWSYGLLLCFLDGSRNGPALQVDATNAVELCREGRFSRAMCDWARSICDSDMRRAALVCLERDWRRRPTMGQIVQILTGSSIAVSIPGKLGNTKVRQSPAIATKPHPIRRSSQKADVQNMPLRAKASVIQEILAPVVRHSAQGRFRSSSPSVAPPQPDEIALCDADCAGILLNEQWLTLSKLPGGILKWNEDVDGLRKYFVSNWFDYDMHTLRHAAADSWEFVCRNPQELAFQMQSRLVDVTDKAGLVKQYLDSLSKCAEKPLLRSHTRCWRYPGVDWPKIIEHGSRGVEGLCLTPTGNEVLTFARKKLRLIEFGTGQVLREYCGHEDVASIAVSADGRQIVSGSYGNNPIRIWDTATGMTVGEPLFGHAGIVTCVAMSPDGKRVVSGSSNKTILVWLTATGKTIGEPLVGHTGWVWSVAVSPDGGRIVSGSGDLTIRIWDFVTRKCVGLLRRGHLSVIAKVEFLHAGLLKSTDSTAQIRFWRERNGILGSTRVWTMVSPRNSGVTSAMQLACTIGAHYGLEPSRNSVCHGPEKKVIATLPPVNGDNQSWDYHADSRRLAVCLADGQLLRFEVDW